MGIDPLTAMIVMSVGSGVLGARSANKQAKASADAAVLQGNLELQKMKKQADVLKKATMTQVASQKTSFLSSGLALEGTPMDVMSETYDLGILDLADLQKDMGTTATAYNQQSKNIITQGKSEALSSLTSGVSSAALMGYSGGFGSGITDSDKAWFYKQMAGLK